ncbi:hypothetical protein LCGC14_2041560 [marine sediment metagenome]|uniref:Uncharacterized protein n=1 Tax=marine sediment metagenome TaxID=412755 RepID=A0A0F9ERN3_9ZZZZ
MVSLEEKLKDILLDLMLHHRYIIKNDNNRYRFVCEYNKDFPDGYYKCPNNQNGICVIEVYEIPWILVHKYNGRKMWKCPCG